jgi:predicted PurR-regulated permease PerM
MAMGSGSRFKAVSEWCARFMLIVAAIAVIGWVLLHVLFVVVPVIAALLIATLLIPPANWLRRHGWRPALATTLVVLVALLVVAGLAAMVGPPVASRFGQLGDELQHGVRSVQHWLIHGPLHLSQNKVNDLGNSVIDAIRGGGNGNNAGKIATGVLNAGLRAAEYAAGAVLGFVLLVFFVKDGRLIWEWLVGLVPARGRPRARQLGEESWHTLSQYVHGIILVAAFDAVFIGIALAIIGIPLVLPLMVIIFVTAFIPIVGAWASGTIATLVALVTAGLLPAVGVVIAFIIVNQLEAHVLYPVVVGRTLSLHPVAVIAGVALGGSVLGIVGALFSVPFVAVIGRIIAAFRAGPPPGGPEATMQFERHGDVDVVLLPPEHHG